MTELVKMDEDGGAWYPVTIHKLETYLGKYIESGQGYNHVYVLRKDLAYNLQYLQFQDRVLQDIKLSSVIYTQSIKTIILISCSIIESLLHYSLIKNGVHAETEWKEKTKFKGNQKKLDGEYVRIDTTILSKLPKPEFKHMTFDAMIKCAKSNSIFGSSPVMYEKLEKLRVLRNRVHLQVTEDKKGTDWTSFQTAHLNDTYMVMYSILISSLFNPTPEEKKYFKYLHKKYGA